MANASEIVHSDPDILGGTPVFVGTRVPVKSLYDHLEAGDGLDEFLDGFPSVTREQPIAALELGREMTEAHVAASRWMRSAPAETRPHRPRRPARRRHGLVFEANGELLQLMLAAQFAALLTVDQNFEFQQNVRASGVGVIVLLAKANRIKDSARSCLRSSRRSPDWPQANWSES
jgi:uncharacterized protein (DUF433 family)